jgi:aspartate ammonia-lyase
MRREKDSLGFLDIPEELFYGIHTARAVDNFGKGLSTHDPRFITAYLQVKKAAAQANEELGHLDAGRARAIIQAIDELIAAGSYEDIVVNPMGGGAGTSLNMNVNEVVANHALVIAGKEKGDYGYLHPLNHVNLHQSTNDTYPSALRVAMLVHLNELEAALVSLQESLQAKEKEFGNIVKLGRTELQDALPMTVGMQFSAWAEAIARDRWRIFKARERIKVLNIGGTAIGTGFNAPQKFIFLVIEKLKKITGLNITRAENMVEATQNLDSVVEVSGLMKNLAVNLLKLSEDIRLLSSGPAGGFGELVITPLQEGSSIMPGKVNPVMLEFASQTALLVMANDNAISHASGLGNLELNQFYPLVATLMLQNFTMLTQAVSGLDRKVIQTIEVNREKITAHLTNSVALLTYLAQHIGHDKAAEVYMKMKSTGLPMKDIMAEDGILTEAQFDDLTAPERIRMMGYKA